MPFYEFVCLKKKCGVTFDALCPYDDTGKWANVCCPKCGSKKKEKLISMFNFQFSQPQDTDRWNSESKGHDYRFKHNIPKVKEERKMAEAMSHMGSNPYADNSEKDFKLDTGIHDAETRSGLS